MSTRSKWSGLLVLALCVLGLVAANGAFASGADPKAIVRLKQPDGRSFLAHIWGDEFIHGYQTLGGYTVALDWRTKTWMYAERGTRGRLKPSDAVVTEARPPAQKHLRPTLAAFNRARNREGASPLWRKNSRLTAPNWAGADTDILFIMVSFTDVACSFTPAQMQTNMFGGGASGPKDLDGFFDEISYGDLQFVGRVVGDNGGTTACVPLANNRAFYNNNVANPDGDDDLVREALADIDANIDFSDYDNNGDGQIDALGIIFAGGAAHDGCAAGTNADNLWPHSGGVNGGQTVDGGARTVTPFIINSEVTYDLTNPPPPVSDCNQIQTIGLFAHELGHSLGLPDLYDTDVGNGGVHVWSTMASQYLGTKNNADTPPHYDPWSKAFLDWITPTVHQPGDRFVESITQVENSPGEVHQFRDNPGGFQNGSGSGEYFLVENREQTGFDQQLPGCGILVWHIDEAVTTGNTLGGHTAGSHRLVDIDEADGLAQLDANGAADAGDPFPGSTNNRLLDGSTNPSSDLYSGADSNVRMWVQSTACGSSMNVAFGPNQAPVADAGGPYTTNEGTNVGLTAANSNDSDVGDTLTYAWDLDNDGQYDDSTSQTPTFTTVGDNNLFTVGVKVTDTFGSSSTDSSTVTVNNVKPSVASLTNDGPQVENTAISIDAVISDPGWLDTFKNVTVDWDDSAGPQALTGGVLENVRDNATLTFEDVSHTYGDDGVFTVEVCATDDDDATTDPCGTTDVTITNVKPTAVIDLTGTVVINGIKTFVAHEGQTIPFTANSFDTGSDDRTTTWNWNDGLPTPDVTTFSPNDAILFPLADPDPSPTINSRTVTDPEPHAFSEACFYTVMFGASDDDAGSASDQVAVIIAGNASAQRGSGYWQTQYRPRPTAFSETRRQCYLAIARFMSTVFSELQLVNNVAQAFDTLNISNNSGSETQKLDRELLAAWLNFANGAFDLTELVDTDGKGGPDTMFATVMANAEAVRIGPSTGAQKIAQRNILERINGK